MGQLIGANVHYVAYNGTHLAGMVIGFDEDGSDLVVFTSLRNVNGVKNFGTQFHTSVRWSGETGEQRVGTYHHIRDCQDDDD